VSPKNMRLKINVRTYMSSSQKSIIKPREIKLKFSLWTNFI